MWFFSPDSFLLFNIKDLQVNWTGAQRGQVEVWLSARRPDWAFIFNVLENHILHLLLNQLCCSQVGNLPHSQKVSEWQQWVVTSWQKCFTIPECICMCVCVCACVCVCVCVCVCQSHLWEAPCLQQQHFYIIWGQCNCADKRKATSVSCYHSGLSRMDLFWPASWPYVLLLFPAVHDY